MTRKFAEFMENNKDEINEICDWAENGSFEIHVEKLNEMSKKIKRLRDEFEKMTGYDHDERWLFDQMTKYNKVERIPDDERIPELHYCNISKFFL